MQQYSIKKEKIDTHIWLYSFIDIYQKLNTENLFLLSDIYHQNVTFTDPMHQVEGVEQLTNYFEKLYENLSSCDFVIENVLCDGEQAAIYWKMSYQHKKLNKGDIVIVEGNSLIKGQGDKVLYHRDYLDLGAMLYEQLPVFGKLTKWIKTKAAQ